MNHRIKILYVVHFLLVFSSCCCSSGQQEESKKAYGQRVEKLKMMIQNISEKKLQPLKKLNIWDKMGEIRDSMLRICREWTNLNQILQWQDNKENDVNWHTWWLRLSILEEQVDTFQSNLDLFVVRSEIN